MFRLSTFSMADNVFEAEAVEGTVHICYLEHGLEVILCNPRIKRSPKADTTWEDYFAAQICQDNVLHNFTGFSIFFLVRKSEP